jgi:hypothetical protein
LLGLWGNKWTWKYLQYRCYMLWLVSYVTWIVSSVWSDWFQCSADHRIRLWGTDHVYSSCRIHIPVNSWF